MTLAPHSMTSSDLSPKQGKRVEVMLVSDIAFDQAIELVNEYHDLAKPDGQIVIRKPSHRLNGAILPYLVENFDGRGPTINADFH